jgi:hypothetical protein
VVCANGQGGLVAWENGGIEGEPELARQGSGENVGQTGPNPAIPTFASLSGGNVGIGSLSAFRPTLSSVPRQTSHESPDFSRM